VLHAGNVTNSGDNHTLAASAPITQFCMSVRDHPARAAGRAQSGGDVRLS
jgi:hypothetical protein